MAYGKEVILDLYECDVSKFNRESIEQWLKKLCFMIGMKREDLHFWDFEGVPAAEIPFEEPHLVGTSGVNVLTNKIVGACQFITTSDIVIHTVDTWQECYINIFSCKDFSANVAYNFTQRWFGATKVDSTIVVRGKDSKHEVADGEIE